MKRHKHFTFILIIALLLVGLIIVVIITGLCMPQVQNVLQGQAETTDYRVSSKVPARVLELTVSEGDFVHRGDTLVRLESPDINAKLSQAEGQPMLQQMLKMKRQKTVLVQSKCNKPMKCTRWRN